MLKNLLVLLACSMAAPSVMAYNDVSYESYVYVNDDDDDDDDDDDRDDDKDKRVVGLQRPVIECRNISKSKADVFVKVRVHNRRNRPVNAIVQVEIENQEGRRVAFVNDKVTIPAGKSVVSKNVVTIKNPCLHSANPSYRYEAEAEVVNLRGDEISESKETKFYISRNYGAARKHQGSVLKGRQISKKLQKQVR